MSLPARRLDTPPALPRPRPPRSAPARTPARRPTRTPARRARRGFHVGFWAFAALLLTAIVLALVSLSALVVETGLRIDHAEDRLASLADRREVLLHDVARLGAPGRIAAWATERGLVMPEGVVVLQVPGGATAGEGADDAAGAEG